MDNPNIAVLVDYGGTIFQNFGWIAKTVGYEGYIRKVDSQISVQDVVSDINHLNPNVALIAHHWGVTSRDGKGLELIAALNAQQQPPVMYLLSNDPVTETATPAGVQGTLYLPNIETIV